MECTLRKLTMEEARPILRDLREIGSEMMTYLARYAAVDYKFFRKRTMIAMDGFDTTFDKLSGLFPREVPALTKAQERQVSENIKRLEERRDKVQNRYSKEIEQDERRFQRIYNEVGDKVAKFTDQIQSLTDHFDEAAGNLRHLFEEQKALTGTPAPNEVAAVAVPVGSCGGINVDIYNGANKIFNYVCPIEKKKDYARLLFLFNELERLEQTEMQKTRNSSLCTRFKTPMGRWFKITLTDATGVKKKEHGFSLKVSGRFVGDGTLRDEASFTREEGLLVYELKNRLELALLSIPQAERYFRVDRTRLCLADGSDPKKTVEEYDREAIEKSLQNAENTDEEESEIWKRRAEYLKLRLLIEEESI